MADGLGGSRRKLDATKRRTVCGQLEHLLLSVQFWYEQAVATIWWDLDLLYQSMRTIMQFGMKRNKWLIEFHERVAVDIQMADGDLPFQLWEIPADWALHGDLNRNIASSRAVYTFMARSIDKSLKEEDAQFFLNSLLKLLPHICRIIDTVLEGTVDVGRASIVIDRLGQVRGFQECMCQAGIHKLIRGLVKKEPPPLRIDNHFPSWQHFIFQSDM